jgi:hypothetical protein
MSGANASPIGRSHQVMSGANASPIGRSHQLIMNRFRLAVLAICFAPILSAHAQDKGSIDLRGTFGMRTAITGGACTNGNGQAMGGASLRFHATSRVSIGPEVLFVNPCDRQTFTFYHPQMSGMLHLAVDLSEGSRVRPYLVGGGGFVRHRSSLSGRPATNRMEAAGGGGVKIFLSDRVFVAPEVQFGGRVAFVRVTGSLGILLR